MVYGQLHQLIDQCRWDAIIESSTRNDSSLEVDVREAHRDDLPLHMVCERRAPNAVILEVLKLYPEASAWRGRGGNLALHVATHRNLDEEVMEALIRANPEALDEVNQANFTPRHIGHSDSDTLTALRRPTSCWHQLIGDEHREEEQATRLKKLHEKVDTALEQTSQSDANMSALLTRLQHGAESRLESLESLQHENSMTNTIRQLQESLREGLETTENRLTTVEDDIKAAAAREFMAKAASRAHQSDIMRMQKKTGESAKRLRQQVEHVRTQMMGGTEGAFGGIGDVSNSCSSGSTSSTFVSTKLSSAME
jgi:hypothetical protein